MDTSRSFRKQKVVEITDEQLRKLIVDMTVKARKIGYIVTVGRMFPEDSLVVVIQQKEEKEVEPTL